MRRFLVSLLIFALAVATAPPFVSANKNKPPGTAFCDNGKTYTSIGNGNSSVNGAVLLVGVGPVKTISLTLTDPATGEVVFSGESNYPKPANLHCHGTVAGLDFVVDAYAKRT
jgi:hypothetical protein